MLESLPLSASGACEGDEADLRDMRKAREVRRWMGNSSVQQIHWCVATIARMGCC